ncbi:hypothetical protein BJX63DRAFT_395398 [Aspergillus granulosus]|uniref:Zinc finger PHD-type domain-containing protein n=1 Tax=Aspergillus granulosus TaxID=176169 RepID=A0ABR4HCS2_9EURO
MPARKSQARNSKFSSKSGRAKRTRPDSPDAPEDPARNQMASKEPCNPSTGAPLPLMSWDETVAKIRSEPMNAQIQRYKDWKRNGSKHETICRVCFKDGTSERCNTCRLTFHPECLKNSSGCDIAVYHSSHLYCEICCKRGWHRSPPLLTPPTSPVLRPTNEPEVPATSEPAPSIARTISIPDLVSHPSNAESRRPSSPRPLQERSEEATYSASTPNQPLVSHAVSTISIKPQYGTVSTSEEEHNNRPPAPKRQRKSRFATLPHEVEASLSVLYRELESVTSLRLQIEELQSQNSQQMQQIKLRENFIAILRRDLEQSQAADVELARLRASISQQGAIQKEVEELRAENVALEAELKKSRAETATAQELVKTWKGKLTQLLDT